MRNLESRLARLEEFQNHARNRDMTDAELAVRLFAAFNGPDPVDQDLVDLLESFKRSDAS